MHIRMTYSIFIRVLLSVLLHAQFGAFPNHTLALKALRLWVITGLQRECSKVFQQSVGPEKWLEREAARKLLHFITHAAFLTYYSPAPSTVIPQNCDTGNRAHSPRQAQWQRSFVSGCRECHHIYPHRWQIWPLTKLLFTGKTHDCCGPAWRWCHTTFPRPVLQSSAAPGWWQNISKTTLVQQGFHMSQWKQIWRFCCV